MKMITSMVTAKLNIKSNNKQAKLNKKRTSLKHAYGKVPALCKTDAQLCEWHMQQDPYMAELFED